MRDFSKLSEECYLTVDKNGTRIKEGDVLTSNNIPLRGGDKVKEFYKPAIRYNNEIVIPLSGSYLLNYYVKAHCEIVNV